MPRRVGLFAFVLAVVSVPAVGRAEHKYLLSVAPAAVPTPLLKYQLLPDPRDLKPGNAATLYYRTESLFVENPDLLKELRSEEFHNYATTPLKDLPLAQVEGTVNSARYYVRELELASRCRDLDWQIGDREEGIALIIPDVQGFRMLGNLLAVKARVHIAKKEYDEAVRAMRYGYTLGRHLGRGPTLIHSLVGLAIVGMMDNQLDSLIQQPDAPNLYWALRTLPRPLFDHRPILLEESQWMERMWPFLARVDKGILTVEETQAGVAMVDKRVQEFGLRRPPLHHQARAAAIAAMHGASKTWLVENGYRKEMVEAMNPVQAVTLATYKQYRQGYDEWLVWALAGESDSHPGMKAARDKANAAGATFDRLFFGNLLQGLFDGGVIPAVRKIEETGLRSERRHTGLAIIEALRLHAAKTGKWPETLVDITAVPVPVDPVTRKPWDFKKDGDVVTLTSPLADGEKATSNTHFIFRVALREK